MASTTGSGGFSAAERKALKERAAELRTEAERPRGGKAAAEELDVLEKIAAMDAGDRALAERIHAIVTEHAPDLRPKLWYSQPAYARKGKVVCFFRSGVGDGERYSTFGFTPHAELDGESGVWATSYAVRELTADAERTITALVKRVAQ